MPPMRQSPGCEARAMLVAWEHRDSLPFVLSFQLINYTITSWPGPLNSRHPEKNWTTIRGLKESSLSRVERTNGVFIIRLLKRTI